MYRTIWISQTLVSDFIVQFIIIKVQRAQVKRSKRLEASFELTKRTNIFRFYKTDSVQVLMNIAARLKNGRLNSKIERDLIRTLCVDYQYSQRW